MSRNQRSLGILIACASLGLVLALTASSCSAGSGSRPPRQADPSRVVAHSSGLIPSGTGIKVVLAKAGGGSEPPAGVFRFQPALAGKALWEDERTLVFSPDRPLRRGKTYRVDLDLGLLDGGAPGGSDYFSFMVRAAEQRVAVETLPPRIAGDGSLFLEGSLSLAEGISAAAAEKALSSSEGTLAWRHESERLHRFTVSHIAPNTVGRSLALRWSLASGPGGTLRGNARIKLPSSAAFELISARSLGEESASRGVELAFSRPIDRGQDLRGLVSVEGVEELRFGVSGSTLSLYSEKWPASAKIRVEKGLRDSSGASLAQPASATLAFDWEKPRTRFLTKGNILPTSQGLILPIETMNLSGVIVEALRVRGDNVLQFLQVNDLDSSNELKRVGEVVWRKDIPLDWKDDWKNRWVRQGLDLGPLLAQWKEGMFQIRVTFRIGDIRYVGPKDHDFKDLRFPDDRVIDRDDGENSFWSFVEEWAGGYDDYYAYKDDPLHPAYYLPSYDHDITIRRNVVVSDIGASLKRESDGTWHAAASDLRSARPLAGAMVTLYNFQRRTLASGLTDASGLVLLRPEADPSFATLQSGSQTSWLKVDEGSSLAAGHFDVGGEKADSGLKGFLYGERGVWRPGDAIHLSFILYDRSGLLPSKYPIAFELEDPLGRIVRAGTYTESVRGFYSIETSTSQDAPTGGYVARVKAGGRTFSRNLRVETVMPNRLKISLDWKGSQGPAPALSSDTDRISLQAAWLTGAKVGALKSDLSATFSAAGTSFSSLPDYSFDDPTRTVSGDRLVLFDGRLGSDGKTSFGLDLSPGASLPPGKLKANLLARVFEPSGIFSSESSSPDFHPFSRYVGLRLPKGDAARGMLLVDKDQRVDLALVDREGRLVKGGGEVEVALYQLEWRWWWEKGDESLAQRAAELFQKPIKKGKVRIGADGRGSWSFQVKYPSWGRYLVRVVDSSSPAGPDGGHASGKIVYIDWPGWAGRGRDSGGAEAMLELQAGATTYAPGDRASVSFPSNDKGRALVQVERAGRILREEWLATKKETTVYEFAVTPAMAPNVYVHVTFIQPHLQTANDLPIRLYGIIPVMVEDPATRLKPLIEAASSLSPGSETGFTVREASGRPMTYTVAVVDEGLLGITRFQAPDPWNEFYKKEASSLSAWDLYQYVAGAFSGQLETLLAIGGSDEALGGGSRKPSRFPPLVYYFPPRELKAGETAHLNLKLGSYIGALRFMVTAGSQLPLGPASARGTGSAAAAGITRAGAAFGSAELSVPVRAELMGQLTAPRILSPGEEAAIPATVFAFMGANRANVKLQATGSLSMVGEDAKSLSFKQDGDLSALFRVRAASSPGFGTLRLVAEMEGRRAEESINIEVRSVGLPVGSVTGSTVGGGATWKSSIELPGQAGTNSLSVELSRLRSLDLAERLDWLIQYPHGCAEQTTSAAFPQIYLPKAVVLDADKAASARDNVAAAIDRLRGFQTARGGFTMWPGAGNEDDWISAYVPHFLLAARREGFEVPEGLMDGALGYLARSSRTWASSEAWSQSVQAYRLYDLALAGAPEIAAMNRFRDAPGLPVAATYRLAAAYAMAGMTDAATALVRGLSTEVADYPDMVENTYGGATRDRAVVLDALGAMGDTDRALPVYNALAEELGTRRWFTTQDLGAALGAALPYAILAASAEAPTVSVGLEASPSVQLKLDRPMARLDLPAPPGSRASVSIRNSGSTPLYARILARGTPAAGQEKPLARGLSLSLRYLGMDGKGLDPASVDSGTDFVVEATVINRSGQKLKNLALTQLLPSGWEIANYRVGSALPKPREEGEEKVQAETAPPLYDYQDIRDDRVLSYFGLIPAETKVFKTYVTKAYEGIFFLPASSVGTMYDERYQALVPGRWLGTGSARH